MSVEPDRGLRVELHRAVGETPQLDADALTARLVSRRRTRTAARAASVALSIVVVALAAPTIGDRLVPWTTDPGVELVAPVLSTVDARTDVMDLPLAPVQPGAEQPRPGRLSAAELRLEPTQMPDGARRCAGPVAQGAISVTAWCLPDGEQILIQRGPHFALPETGTAVDVVATTPTGGTGAHGTGTDETGTARTGYVVQVGGQIQMTVSDADHMDDVHHRVSAAGTVLTVADAATILASIPAVAGPPAETQ